MDLTAGFYDPELSGKLLDTKKVFIVLHPKTLSLNLHPEIDPDLYDYDEKYFIMTSNIDMVFKESQKDIGDSNYTKLGIRSTSVGDVIYSFFDRKFFMIMPIGFRELPFPEMQDRVYLKFSEVRE